MTHFKKHSKSITALIDATEGMLNALEQHGVDPETVANKPEFTVFIHFLKSIIDDELNIPNKLTDAIKEKSEELGFNLGDISKRLH
tara:strand:+ start:72 stop:329 length:258 start_codon:yes stop_codon:yes gene_type:complete